MNKALLQKQVRGIVLEASSGEVLTHKAHEVPYVPEEIPEEDRFHDQGGGLLEGGEYTWRVRCHTEDFLIAPVLHDEVQIDGRTFHVGKIGRVKATGEVLLYFENPDQ